MTEQEMEDQFRRAAESAGMELLVGDFVLRSGQTGRYLLRPRNLRRLLRMAVLLLEEQDR